MKNKYIFVVTLLICIFVVSLGLTNIYVSKESQKEKEVNFTIVTSFYPIYIATLNVVDNVDGVRLENLSEPQTGCLHDYQMTTADMKLLSKADAFVVNGGGIESFLTEVAASYPKLTIISATQDVSLIADDGSGHSHGDEDEDDDDEEEEVNAHAWMSVADYRIMVQTIADELSAADPDHADQYRKNAKEYDAKLAELAQQQQTLRSLLDGTHVISFHESFTYVAKDYNLDEVCTIDFDEERPVSAGEVAQVIEAIQHDGASYILAEELYGKEMADTVLAEDDVEVTVLYLDPLNKGVYNKDAYIRGMQANIDLLKKAMVE